MKTTTRLMRFCAGGALGTLGYYSVFYALLEWRESWYVAWASIAFAINVVITFFAQKHWTFQNKETAGFKRQVFRYVVAAVLFGSSSSFLIWLFVEHRHLKPLPASVVVAALLALPSFFIQKWIFRIRPTNV